jgi:hypothetical protein
VQLETRTHPWMLLKRSHTTLRWISTCSCQQHTGRFGGSTQHGQRQLLRRRQSSNSAG